MLRIRNFQRYVAAQLASGAGMWNQRVAELWLLLALTGDGLSLGVGTALRTAPALFLATPAGWLADRFDRRTLLSGTQAARGVVGGVFALVAAADAPRLGVVYAMILALGVVNALDGPMRRSYVRDVVDRDQLRAAAGLHTATISIGRVIGPLVAGLVISAAGIPWAFAVSVVTAALAIVAVRSIVPIVATGTEPQAPEEVRPAAAETRTARPVASAHGPVKVSDVLVMLGVFSVLGWNVDVVLPVLADSVLGRGPVAFSGLVMCLSLGTFVGSVTASNGAHAHSRLSALTRPLFLFGCALPLVAVSDQVVVVAVAVAVAGAFGGAFLSEANAAMQLAADPGSQGRTVAVYSIVFTGSRALGAPVLGWAIDRFGPRPSIAMVGAFTVVAGIVAVTALWSRQRRAGS